MLQLVSLLSELHTQSLKLTDFLLFQVNLAFVELDIGMSSLELLEEFLLNLNNRCYLAFGRKK